MSSRWIWSLSGAVALAVSVSAGACNSGSNEGASGADASADGTTGAVCTTNADCASRIPQTTPANCAVGTCDRVKGLCVFSAPDDDNDGFTAADCKSTSGVAVTNTGDCNDHDPNLYPGHPEACDVGPDGGAPQAGFCAGRFSCLSNGDESPCMPTLVCTNACVDAGCTGVCAPGQTNCAGQQPQTCDGQGQWQANRPACGSFMACCGGACLNDQTDTNNCGACGNVCAAGPSLVCSAGRCMYTLAQGEAPYGIAVDATNVYWTDIIQGTVMKVPFGGGTATTLATGQLYPSGVSPLGRCRVASVG